jgi:hypothetical protein
MDDRESNTLKQLKASNTVEVIDIFKGIEDIPWPI